MPSVAKVTSRVPRRGPRSALLPFACVGAGAAFSFLALAPPGVAGEAASAVSAPNAHSRQEDVNTSVAGVGGHRWRRELSGLSGLTVVTTLQTWHEARAHCAANRGALVSIRSAEQNAAVRAAADAAGVDAFWVGGSDAASA